MRTFDRLACTLVLWLGVAAVPALAFDGSTTTQVPGDGAMPSLVAPPAGSADNQGGARALAAPVAPTPFEAFRSGTEAMRAGETKKAVISLQYAAEKGHALAQWQLGRMYAKGEGVPRNDYRAFEYFSRIATAHAYDNPNTRQARFVANAFVALGHYYLVGIPNTAIRPDADRAHEMFYYAASYFGDPDGQYNLGRLYLDGIGSPRDPRQAARWLRLAANKGQHQAQAVFGRMLFKGEVVPRQAAKGLMFLTLARDGAAADEAWIGELCDAAFKQATDDERAMALRYLERWLQGQRD